MLPSNFVHIPPVALHGTFFLHLSTGSLQHNRLCIFSSSLLCIMCASLSASIYFFNTGSRSEVCILSFLSTGCTRQTAGTLSVWGVGNLFGVRYNISATHYCSGIMYTLFQFLILHPTGLWKIPKLNYLWGLFELITSRSRFFIPGKSWQSIFNNKRNIFLDEKAKASPSTASPESN